MNKKIILSILVVIVIVIAVIFLGGGGTSGVKNDPISMVNLSMKMEADLSLQDVVISEVAGGVMEVRLKNPDNVSREDLAVGTAYIFGYLESSISTDIQKIRVIYTVNYLDSIIYEASLSDISSWKNKSIDTNEFAKRIKFAEIKLQ